MKSALINLEHFSAYKNLRASQHLLEGRHLFFFEKSIVVGQNAHPKLCS